ncbi:CBL-interacting serine/threonine-protein kinase 8-like [Gossypium australe]|uniref:non-specific serine/threonine protein kinase n=1 Tax=Gossypium australe TaxID=47621 RepID=A0A5B6W5W2_9ROSI|nr:CBL-interacting serine/threonine-protein kinase 8-like [Gossypium australe]
MVVRKVGKYEIGRTIGEGTFAKVKFAQNTETGESVAVKVLDRSTIIKHKMVDQIKREISIMKLVRHPYVVRLHEVVASRTKIYIILEFITGGELFDKIVHKGRLSEAEARRFFQQLIDGVEYCHSKGVYHRDLKPENLLLDSLGNLKISDFGLSALPEQGVSLLRTTCGTPNYVAPEVLSHKGYDGAVADVWSCGVILYVLMAGYLPFDELDLTTLYSKIERADFSCPSWFPVGAKSLIHRILDPNPQTFGFNVSFCLIVRNLPSLCAQRITIEQIRSDEWFNKGYVPVRLLEYEDINLDEVNAVFDDPEVDKEERGNEPSGNEDMGPLSLNAFDLIILSQGLNLATLFDRGKDNMKYQTRFVSQKPARVVLSSMEVVAQSMGYKTHIRNYKSSINKFLLFLHNDFILSVYRLFHQFEWRTLFPIMRVEGLSANKNSHLSVILEVFEVAPTFLMVDMQKAAGDAGEYLKFYQAFYSNLEEIIWKPPNESSKTRITKSRSKRR